MTVYLKDLCFGSVDGDTESNYKDFLDLFYTGNNKYDEITNDPMKFIICGKKGTGKTILGRYIEKIYTREGIACRIFNKDDITLGKIIEKNNEILSSDEAVHLFKWIIYTKMYETFKLYSLKYKICSFNELKQIRKYKRSMNRLSKIFSERYPKGNYEFLKYDSKCEYTLSSESTFELVKKFITYKLKGETKFAKDVPYTKKEFYKVLTEVEENIFNCLETIDIVIILDDVDELDINLSSDNNSALALNMLIDAFKSINLDISKRELSPSKCILLLRSDIIENLNKKSNNLNKIIQSNTVELYWIDKENEYPEKHELVKMILNKVKRTCDEYQNYSDAVLYKKLFPEDINGESAITYMINYSFGRPRDIICYLDIIKRRYPNETAFTRNMFRECRQAYSNAFFKELENEMKIHLDNEVTEQYLDLIRTFGRNTFYESDIKKYYRSERKNYKKISDFSLYLNTLYKFGVIGNSWKVSSNSNERIIFSWGYRKDGNPNADMSKKFTVHYGFRKILNTN